MKLSPLEIKVISYKNKLPKDLVFNFNSNFDKQTTLEILNFYEFCNNSVYSLRKRRSNEPYFNHISRIANHSLNLNINDKLVYYYYAIHDLEEENDVLIKENKQILTKPKLKEIISTIYGKELEQIMDIFTPKPTNRKTKLSEKIFQSQSILDYEDIRMGVCKFFDTYDNTQDLHNLKYESLKGKLGQVKVLQDYFEKKEKLELEFLGNPKLKENILNLLSKRDKKIKKYLNLK